MAEYKEDNSAKVYNQGDEYDEEDYDEEDIADEGSEDTESKITALWGIPVKTFAIVGAALLVVVLAFVIFSTRRSKTPASSDDIDPAILAEANDTYTDTSSAVDNTSDYDSAPSDSTGNDSLDGMVYNHDTGLWEEVAAADSGPVTPTDATSDEVLLLRRMGYTGDEIEFCLSEGFSVQELVDAAQELYDEEADEALKRMSDSASEEFRYIVDNTYFSQTGYEFVSLKDAPFGSYDYYQRNYTVNADYVKCPTYGSQLQLKCRVAQDLWVWYVVTPERWDSLPSEGNIVLRVNYTQYGVNMYVTSVTETDPTLDTIDSSSATAAAIMDSADANNVADGGGEDVSEDTNNKNEGEPSSEVTD
ncbi:MAG: hypothetical protein NC548_31510 [Lachnospiraceae bacterium]|nr:hypothetical protein [Lachnospiraceae bacterium]